MAKRAATKTSFKKGNAAAKGRAVKKGGRPRDDAKRALKDLLVAPDDGHKERLSLRDQALIALRKALAKADTVTGVGAAVRAAELILAYTDGQPTQKVGFTGEMKVIVEYDD